MYKYGMILLLLGMAAHNAGAQVFTDPAAAFETAQARDKPVLLVFQGSDWCIPCINLEHKVLSQPVFLEFVEDKLVLLKADFPQNKKVEAALEKQYEALAEAYDREGRFPKMILLGRHKEAMHIFRTDYTLPAELVHDLEPELKKYHAKM